MIVRCTKIWDTPSAQMTITTATMGQIKIANSGGVGHAGEPGAQTRVAGRDRT